MTGLENNGLDMGGRVSQPNDGGRRTDNRLAILLDFKRTLAISDQKRKIKQVFDGLRKIVRVGDEPEKVHRAILLHEQASYLYFVVMRTYVLQ